MDRNDKQLLLLEAKALFLAEAQHYRNEINHAKRAEYKALCCKPSRRLSRRKHGRRRFSKQALNNGLCRSRSQRSAAYISSMGIKRFKGEQK